MPPGFKRAEILTNCVRAVAVHGKRRNLSLQVHFRGGLSLQTRVGSSSWFAIISPKKKWAADDGLLGGAGGTRESPRDRHCQLAVVDRSARCRIEGSRVRHALL